MILVIVNHLALQNEVFRDLKIKNLQEPLIDFLQDGHFGVNFFFVISGFHITSLLLLEEVKSNGISLKKL